MFPSFAFCLLLHVHDGAVRSSTTHSHHSHGANMTNLELFPRGNGTTEAASASSAPKATGSRKQNQQDAGKKRKAPPTSPAGAGGQEKEKEWLFGTGGDKSKQPAAGKRPKGENSAAAGGSAKGKVSPSVSKDESIAVAGGVSSEAPSTYTRKPVSACTVP